MADPLSISASIIAVLGAAEGIGKTLNKIRNIREAPIELLALINEISDMKVVLSDTGNHFIQNISNMHLQREHSQHMTTLLDRAKEQLLQLDELVQYRLVRPGSTSQKVQLSRREWTLATSTVQSFRETLRDTRLNKIAQMSVINAFVFMTVMYIKAEEINPVIRSYQSRIGFMITEIHTLANGFEETELRTGNERTVQRLDEQTSLLNSILNNQAQLSTLLQPHSTAVSESSRLNEEQSFHSATSIKAKLNYRRFPCTSHCGCACHKSRRSTSPLLVQRAIGTIFLGYFGCPLSIFWRCTESSCQGQQAFQISVIYLFPSWFFARLLAVTFLKRYGTELHVSLKVQRVVPTGAEVFRLVRLDDVTGLKRLFSKGLASLNDVEDLTGNGALFVGPSLLPTFIVASMQSRNVSWLFMMYSALDLNVYQHYFSYYGANRVQISVTQSQWNVCKFLLDAGADTHPESSGRRLAT